jgi:predicted tellurium resistance membrane protein TerC
MTDPGIWDQALRFHNITLIDKARWLAYLGAGAISFTAARMVIEDKAVDSRLHMGQGIAILVSLAAAVFLPGAFLLARRRLKPKE